MISRYAIFLLSLGGLSTACYGTELDTSIDGLFACDADSDCTLGSVCSAGICLDRASLEGPSVRVLEPPPLAVFPAGDTTTIPLVVSGEDLVLTDGSTEEPNAGYIEVLLDGAVVDTITEGDLEAGVAIASIIAPEDAGLHHIGLVARRLDGELFSGEEAAVASAFWIDDGREHVGILDPAPGFKVALESDDLSIEIAALNFTFVNPGFVDPQEFDEPGAGYVHLYIDADVPTCIPACNFTHQAAIMPPGLSRVNRLVAERGVLLPGELGTTRIQIVAQDLLQQPYYREGDATELVFHQVPVQSIVEIDQ